MLKKIPTAQATLGMFLQSMEGSWLSHPFWKTRFLITDAKDLAALKASGVTHIWIDVAMGKDVPTPDIPLPAPRRAAPVVPMSRQAPVAFSPTPPPPPPPSPTERASFAEEMVQAAAVVNRSKEAVVSMFNEARLGRAVSQVKSAAVVEDIANSVWRNPSALISLARLKTRDDYTYMHSVAVSAMMIALAKQLGMNEDEQREAGMAGLLHDVGKMLMPLEVLNKPGSLTDEEFTIMKSHPALGHGALAESGAFAEGVLDVCLHHHEKMDGTGYPKGLPADQITLLARMGAVCDVYDAVTSVRPYKNAWDPAGSLARMAQWKGHFDPNVFQAFVISLGIFPVGTLVKLKSQRLAVVVDQNPGKLTQPVVRVFFSLKSNMPIDLQTLDLSAGGDAIVGREDPDAWGFKHLNDLWSQPR
jgi:putative nucleotidyltransferase with HDIG domain